MNRLMFVVAGAMILAGCTKSEAERFGYKGLDLEDDSQLFFSTSPTVTNYVPARVLSVCESYELTPDEQALMKAVGVIPPGSALPGMPEGYGKGVEEPWFVYWTKGAEALGFTGVHGVLTHFNEDAKTWETGENYFSSYWKTREEAAAALETLRKRIGEEFHAKKFHVFDGSWIAEFVRLRVMGLMGQKPDGTWSCMLDIQDKNRPGCGQWEPSDAQQERRNHYVYSKAMKAWKADVGKALAANHAAIERLRVERGYAPLGEDCRFAATDDGRNLMIQGGTFPFEPPADGVTNAVDAAWAESLAAFEKTVGAPCDGERQLQTSEDGYTVASVAWRTDLYEARLDMAFPAPAEKAAEGAEGGDAAVSQPGAQGQFRIILLELMQPGFSLPARPVLAK